MRAILNVHASRIWLAGPGSPSLQLKSNISRSCFTARQKPVVCIFIK